MDNTTESSTQDVQVKPKNPGRVAWGKELQRLKREEKAKSSLADKESTSTSTSTSSSPSSSLSSWIPWCITGLAIGVAVYIFNRVPTQNPAALQRSEAAPEHRRLIDNPFIRPVDNSP